MPDRPTIPVACSLDGRNLQARIAWIEELNARELLSRDRRERSLTLSYRSAALDAVLELVSNERECCAFLEFTVAPSSDSVVLTITVPHEHAADADALLRPFAGPDATTESAHGLGGCCANC